MSLNYPKQPVIIEEVEFNNYKDAKLFLTRFVEDDIPVLFIGNDDTEEVYIICNINPEHYKLKDFEFAIKNYSENEGMLKWLINNNYMQHPHFSFASGFVDIPVCYATNKLREMIIKICTKEVDT